MVASDEPLPSRVNNYLAGLQAAKRSPHTIDGYRSDLLGIAARRGRAAWSGRGRRADSRSTSSMLA